MYIMTRIEFAEYTEMYSEKTGRILSYQDNYIPRLRDAKHSLLILEDKTVIGIGSLWDNYIHPHRDHISIFIIPDKRRKGLGTLLFSFISLSVFRP